MKKELNISILVSCHLFCSNEFLKLYSSISANSEDELMDIFEKVIFFWKKTHNILAFFTFIINSKYEKCLIIIPKIFVASCFKISNDFKFVL
jgi:hypothetical protein